MKKLGSYSALGLICCFASHFTLRVKKITLFQKNLQFLKNSKETSKGQVIVEYILLLLVSSVMALVLINLVSVDPDKSSPVFNYWRHLIETVGEDIST